MNPVKSCPVRIGIIGCGNVLDAYLPQCHKLRQSGLAELVLAAGRPGQEKRASASGVPRFTTNADEVIQSPEVDLVLILTSMPQHARLACAALEAGKHVLVEKPLAMAAPEFDAVIAARDRTGLLAAEAFMIVHHPQWARAREMVRSGAIGRLVHVDAAFSYDLRDMEAISLAGIDASWAPADEKMTPKTMSRLFSQALATLEKKGEKVTDVYGQKLKLSQLPPDLLALCAPQMWW